jgi:glucose/arabinose dehydrogenase
MSEHGMRVARRARRTVCWIIVAGGAALALDGCRSREERRGAADTSAAGRAAAATAAVPEGSCPGGNGGITLPPGFCATVFADTLGHVRHIVVAPNGDVYVNTWSGRYYPNSPPPRGGFLVVLRDTSRDGRADVIVRFGDTPARGGTGGTGIGLYRNYLYAEAGTQIVRYPMRADGLAPQGTAEVIVSDLPITGDHPMHPFAIDSAGAMYMNSGSTTNSCQEKNRTIRSPGRRPCTELETHAGIWKYDANRTGQQFSPAARYATGIRNAVGIAIGPDGGLYSTQHGRDQLGENWPALYSAKQGQELPSEELLRIERGADYGWPTCYFDGTQQKLVLAPEYGGDGGKAVGDCASKRGPIAFFPAHWAPNGLLFYTGAQFPARYQGGVFIAFHGSWNRAPGPQGGYSVVFVPFASGKPTGPYEVFADGFAGANKDPAAAAHRPAGLAQGPDGALYITDDARGRVWRVVYRGQ